MALETARKRRLTPTGSGFFRGLYRPEMKMTEPIISALLSFDKCPDVEVLAEQFEQHIWPQYRFGSCIVDGHWVPVQGQMDRAYHFVEKPVSDEAEVDALVQKMMSEPLDHKRPLWRCIVMKSKQGRSAVMIRIHHVISDGLGLLFAFLPLMEVEGGDPLAKIPLPGSLTGRKCANRGDAPMKKRSLLTRWLPRCFSNMSISSLFIGWFSPVVMFFRGVMSLLIMKQDSEIRMNPPLAQRTPYLMYPGHHRYSRMPPVSMTAVRAVREKHGCTVNDAIMAALSGAIRKYGAQELKDPLLADTHRVPLECKSFMLLGMPRPIDPKDPSKSLANNILTPVFRLPVDEPTATGRLRRTVAMCNNLKSMAYITGISLTTKFLTSVAPTSIMRSIASEAISKGTANTTCIPLTTVPLSLGGQEVKEVQCIFVNNIPQISLLTYNGFIYWNIVHDPRLIPDAVALGRHFVAEFAELAK